MEISEVSARAERTRAIWSAGDYPTLARELLWDVGPALVERAGVQSGEDVLDIGCGTGNTTLRAAEAGAAATGLDLTPKLLDDGREAAAEAGLDIDWVEGDAQELPFADQRFDVVLSSFGHIFAPDHQRAADEIVRVLRPGGRIGLFCWTATGATGEFFDIVSRHLPPPPEDFLPMTKWGEPGHVSGLFSGSGLELEFELDAVDFRFLSPREGVEFYEQKFGPVIIAKALLESQGKWAALREELLDLFERLYAVDGVVRSEYLAVTGLRT